MLRKGLVGFAMVLVWLGMAVHARDVVFALQSPDGVVTEKSYEGKFLLMAIGFTSCPDICPTTLYEWGHMMKALKNPDAVQPLFVTIDPLNDEIGRLNAYTRYFDPRIVGLTGEMKQIRAFTDLMGATFGYRLDGKKVDNPELGMPYTVYHSSLVYLVSPERKLVDVFDYQIGAKGLTEALDKVLGDAPVAVDKAEDAQAQSSVAVPEVRCPLPDGFIKADKGLALADVLPEARDSKAALVNIWALWCKPCREELPLLDKFAASQQDMDVYALNLGDDAAQVDALFKELRLARLAQTRSEDGGLLDRFGAVGLPFTALFVDGKLVAGKAGVIDETGSFAAFAQCIHQP